MSKAYEVFDPGEIWWKFLKELLSYKYSIIDIIVNIDFLYYKMYVVYIWVLTLRV